MNNVIRLQAENFKRIKAIQIVPPDEPVVTIGGKNGAGKSTTIDIISAALGGKDCVPEIPLRTDTDEGYVEVELRIPGMEDLIVRRTFETKAEKNGDKKVVSSLVVTDRDGARFPAPQSMLDSLYGRVSFDPLEFMRSKDQLTILRSIVGLDFTTQERKRKGFYEARTAVNRDVAEITAQLANTPHHDGVPQEEQKSSAIIEEIDNAVAWNQTRQAAIDLPKSLIEKGTTLKASEEDLNEQIKELQDRLEALQTKRESVRDALVQLRIEYDTAKAVAGAYAPAKDVAALRAKLDELDAINLKVRQNKTYSELHQKLNAKSAESERLTKEMAAIDEAKAKALSEAKMPVPGLSFDETQVLLNGLPLSQASQAEQLRVSVAIGIALNPKLKVLLIRDGSLLDSKSTAMIAEMALAAGAQVWKEVVAEPDENGKYPNNIGVIIEDGTVHQG